MDKKRDDAGSKSSKASNLENLQIQLKGDLWFWVPTKKGRGGKRLQMAEMSSMVDRSPEVASWSPSTISILGCQRCANGFGH